MAGQRNMKVRVQARQEAAKARAEATKDRTPQQQLAALDKAGLTAKKERAKLKKRIETPADEAKKLKRQKMHGVKIPISAVPAEVRGEPLFKALKNIESTVLASTTPPTT